VRNNGAEVQSLDPHKIEGVPESNVNRDLFEGLLVTDVDGHPAPGVAEKWENKDLKSGPSICVKMRNGPTVRRSPPKISFIAGSVWRSKTASPYASYPAIWPHPNIDDIIAAKNRSPTWA
jgi:oligopeptide transport system substrate-binding protein